MAEQITDNVIRVILAENLIGTLATLNDDGSPWATPLHVFADDKAVYWFSKDTHQHSRNIEGDARVSLSLWSRAEGTKGVYISGNAVKLDDAETAKILHDLAAKDGKIPPVFENTSAYRLQIGQINSSKSSEKRWYFYT